jgi:hypothetical protein
MKAKFSFEIDRPRGLVRITMAGFFSAEDIRDFLKARAEAHEALGWAPNQHFTLNDVRNMTAQPQTIVDAFEEILAHPESRSRRLAFVVAPTFVRSQVVRALSGREAKCFTDPALAEAWLFGAAADAPPLDRAAG